MDYDFIIIGSGFGGSVSALRLAEKGYKVAVIEKGKRWSRDDLPKTNWDARKALWLPKLSCYGATNFTLLNDVLILSGVAVGGGSIIYANTLLVPPDEVWDDPIWAGLQDWRAVLPGHYGTAKRYLGVNKNPRETEPDRMLKEYAKSIGCEDTYKPTDVGVFFGEPDVEVADPYFDGEGPARTGCTFCGGCIVGCKVGAKNTLDQNYLYLAEQKGVEVIPETLATLVEPVSDGGYRVHLKSATAVLNRRKPPLTAGKVVFAAGVLGTVPLLLHCKQQGALPKLSHRLGDTVRTNSEALLGVEFPGSEEDFSHGIAITSSIFTDAHTHIEPVRYPKGSDFVSLIATPLTDGGGRIPRFVRWLGTMARHPMRLLRTLWPVGWAKRSFILLVMQTVDNYMKMDLKRRWFWPFEKGLVTHWQTSKRVPTFIPAANQAARAIADSRGGVAMSAISEVVLDVPTTAHILGGCAMGADIESGVIDSHNRVFGYDGLYVIDGSMIGANLGVNPSLTITALAEHAMSHVPAKT